MGFDSFQGSVNKMYFNSLITCSVCHCLIYFKFNLPWGQNPVYALIHLTPLLLFITIINYTVHS